MKPTPQDHFTRREFNTLMLMLVSLFTAGAAGGTEKKKGKLIVSKAYAPPPSDGDKLAIDFPPDEGGWSLTYPTYGDDWRRIEIDPDEISPRVARQLAAAKAAKHGTPVTCRVLGEPVAILKQFQIFEPTEADDRGVPDDLCEDLFAAWRIEWYGDDIEILKPDNNSWWQTRLEFSERERAFVAQWLFENEQRGRRENGLAQALMLSTWEHEKPANFEPWLSQRERKILATFVQWLGTNCGQSFLYEVARRGGMPGLKG